METKTNHAFKLGSEIYDEEKMKEVYDCLTPYFPEDSNTEFYKFWKNMEKVVGSCNVGNMEEDYATAIMGLNKD